jgi:hypothetical protein
LLGRQFETKLKEGNNFVIKGNLHSHVVVSVPEVISQESGQKLMHDLAKELGRPVIMITHNVQFLSVKELSKKEIRKLKELAEVRREKTQAHTDSESGSDRNDLGTTVDDNKTDSDGDRPRIGENGDNIFGADGEVETEGVGGDSVGNEPGDEKGE